MKALIASTFLYIVLFNLVAAYSSRSRGHRKFEEDLENWTGRWFPEQSTSLPQFFSNSDSHGIAMGRIDSNCDDARTNLERDWDGSPVDYTCYYKNRIDPDPNTKAYLYGENIPSYYVAMHKCMNETIVYDDDIPIYGTHRPLWPVYGEYQYVPKQRWIHSLEHGAVVMLYHPCANPLEIQRLRTLVTSCLRRHIITPYYLLDVKRPLALVTWGHRLTMSYVNPKIVTNFIRSKALKGPERIFADGQYNIALLNEASIVTNLEDAILCPKSYLNVPDVHF